jgi:alpha/beta superfamily hydrolase
MDNPVVVRAAEIGAEAGLATLRFNFRGVGASSGQYAGGRGEQEDVIAALDALAAEAGAGRLGLLGYSFGAWMAALAASRDPRVVALALVAPPLDLFDFGCLADHGPGPCLLVAGSRDPHCPLDRFTALAARLPGATVRVIDGADHFFFGKLYPLGEALRPFARALAGP